MSEQPVTLKFQKISPDHEDSIAILTLSRPKAANAFSGEMMQGIADHLDTAKSTKNCRALILRGQGKHFSAGADLNWMKSAAERSEEENIAETKTLSAMFQKLSDLPVPTIAVVQGAAFGGAVGLVSCCDIAIAIEGAKFCLSEVRVGLLPAVILPFLKRKMLPGHLRRYSLSARPFSAEQALAAGLVEMVSPADQIQSLIHSEISALLTGSPHAQSNLKELNRAIDQDPAHSASRTFDAIAKARSSADGQAGLSAFFAKEKPPWFIEIDEFKIEE